MPSNNYIKNAAQGSKNTSCYETEFIKEDTRYKSKEKTRRLDEIMKKERFTILSQLGALCERGDWGVMLTNPAGQKEVTERTLLLHS